jgi:hypothetical protein
VPKKPKAPRASTGNALVPGNTPPGLFEAGFGQGGFGQGSFGGVGLNQSYFTPDFNEDAGQPPAIPTDIVQTVGNADGRAEVQAVGIAADTIELRHREMLGRLESLEKALARIERLAISKTKSASRIGHNNPPEAIELPVTRRRRGKIEAAMRVIAKEPARPKRNPKGVIRAAQWLKTQGIRLLKWFKQKSNAFTDQAITGAALAAGPCGVKISTMKA